MKVRGLLLAAALVFLIPGARADEIILNDGSVVKGKLVRKEPVGGGKYNYVVQVDEAGTTRTLNADQVKRVVKKMPPWEARKKNLKSYKKKLAKLKKPEDWKAQQRMGDWCRKMSLEPEAKQHLDKAYELRLKETPKQTKAFLDLAKWCEKQKMAEQAKLAYAQAYETKKSAEADTAEGHFKLAQWAEGVGLYDIAKQELEASIAKDANYLPAKDALRKIKEKRSPAEEALVNLMVQQKRGWTISFGIADDASPEYLDMWTEKIKRISRWMWDATQGQFFIAEATLEDKAKRCKVNIPAGKMEETKYGGMGVAVCHSTGSPGYWIEIGGKVGLGTIGHEIFHGIFGVLDEYGKTPKCPCIMADAPSPHQLCHAGNHIQSGRQRSPCWSVITGKYEGARFPNPDWTEVSQKGSSYEYGSDTGFNAWWVEGYLTVNGEKWDLPPTTVVKVTNN